jgi:hypothetical protein
MSGLVDAIKARAASIPGLVTDRGEELYKKGISKDDIQYELQFWVSDPRMSDDARSRVIDIIEQSAPGDTENPHTDARGFHNADL